MSDRSAPVVLSVDGVSISFPGGAPEAGRPVVDRVSFELRRGRVLALVGESGSGKSVTAMSTLGLLPRNARVTGSIRLGNEELIGADPARLREIRGGRIGTIFQEPMSAFNPVLSIGAQIGEALRAHSKGLGRASVHAALVDLLASVGIDDARRVLRAFPHELSGGQLQRAMIAMAISGDPAVLIADEPTTALDVTVQAGILDLIRQLRDRSGLAVLLITHDMGVVADLADDVVVMRAGAVVERADVGTLFSRPTEEYTAALLAAVPRLDSLGTAGPGSDRVVIEDRAAEPPALATAASGHAAVTLTNVDVVYDRRGWRRTGTKAVDGVSLEIQAGRILGLVGESGSGKSTVGRAIAGLVPLAAGSIDVAGIDLGAASARALRTARARIGYVFQDPASSLNPRFTIEQSIGEPLRLHSSLDRAGQRTRVADLLDAVQLPADTAGRYQHELSGGQRQRVAIARAIALGPALLIADEPTSALDVSVQALVLDLLRELQGRLGFACLFISHDLAVVHELVDEVAVMHRGRIVESGAAALVLRSPADDYTRRLLAAAPVADPVDQRARREAWRALSLAPITSGVS
ncbi:dipeptide ABC transporter ATP-binding protein [Lacisediminihabitans profunda]|uniref:ABC transporter ATP-binding protein n=1 Tax=Lacisediminihabitans profunda TaxID=2594790 RepID=A0A5C8UQ93_9MICO|nr:ABC transporter ATP-binding protein [Lacisediminihabitans profunda]TXN30646.1 ABC transporter ATP-binding protein [Lacisediminihabitans profunda]